MSNYFPIELSQKYIETVYTSNQELSVYEEIVKFAREKYESNIDVGEDELIKTLSVFLGKKISNQDETDYLSVKKFVDKLVKQMRKDNTALSLTVSDFVNSLLIPLVFAEWQKNKIVYQMDNEKISIVKSIVNPIVSVNALSHISQPFWIDLSKNIGYQEQGALVKIIKTDMDIVIVGWTFCGNDISNYKVHCVEFSIAGETGEIEVQTHKCAGIDSSFFVNFLSHIQSVFVRIEESELTKKTFKYSGENFPVKNRFSEVHIYNVL